MHFNSVIVTHNEDAQRFESHVDGLRALLAYRRFPEDIFKSSEGRVDLLREAIRRER